MPLKITNRQLPEGWVEKKFGEITLLNRGHNPPKSKFINQPKKGYVRFYQIRDGKSDDYEVYVPDTSQLHKVEPDDILMVAYRHIGRVFRGVDGAFNVALCKITNKDRSIIDDDYLFYIIPTEFVRGELMKQAERSLIPSMSVKHLAEIKIPVPPLPEQKRIVAIVDQAFEGIDRAIANTEKNLTNARELFESYLNATLARKGDGWTEKKLGEVCSIGDGNYSSKYPRASEFVTEGVPFLTATNLKGGTIVPDQMRYISEEQHFTLTKGHVIKDDLVIVVRGSSTGNNSVIPEEYEGSNLNSQLAYLRVKRDDLSSAYLFYAFNSPEVQKDVRNAISGSAQPQLPNNRLLEIKISYPSISEQQAIISKLKTLFNEIKRLEAIYQQKLLALNELKQSILQKAFTGELTADTANQAKKTVKEIIAA